MRQNNQPQLYDVLNENGNVIIKNHRHLIPTNEKFTQKFTYNNIIPITTRLPEGKTPQQTENLPKPVASLTTINSSKSIAPNRTKITRSGCVLKKTNRYIEQC